MRTFQRGKRMKSSFRVILTLAVISLIAAGLFPGRLQAQTANFPDPAQVNADYPDEAQRFTAFNILYDDFSRVASKPLSNADYAKSFAYQASSNMIATQQMTRDGAGTQAYRDFNTQCNQLLSDPNFTNSVVAKYSLPAMATRAIAPQPVPLAPTPAPSAPAPVYAPIPHPPPSASPQPTSASAHHQATWLDHWGPIILGLMNMFPGVLFILLLIVFFTTCSLVTAFAAWLVLHRSGPGRKVYPVPAALPGGLPALPKNLQIVSVPGVRYAVYVLSGMVLETKSTSHTRTFTTVTGGGTIQTTTGQTVTGLPQTHYHTSTTVEDSIWIRQPNGIDAQISIFDGNFQCRAGHLISVLVRQAKDGGYIILAYNHSMGALTQCPALDQSHEARGNELGQWAANIAGGIAAWIFMAMFMNSRDEGGIIAGFVVYWLVATFILVCISFFICTPLVKSRILKRRNNRFRSQYLPSYRQFFEQGTPILQRTCQSR
jgi:predicted membrane protein